RGATDRARRLEGIGWARGARPGAVLGHVAGARRRPAHRAGRQEGVGGTGCTRPGARLGHVADTGRGAADRAARLEGVGRTARARAVAGLGHVARAGRGAADGARVPRRVRAGGGAHGAVTHLGGADVPVVRAGRAGRFDGVGRAGGARAGARLGHVAGAGRGAADRAARLEAVGRTARARAVTAFRHVARAGRGAAHRPRIAHGVLADVAAAIAEVGRARISIIGAGRA